MTDHSSEHTSGERMSDEAERLELERLEKKITDARDHAEEAVEGSFYDEPQDRFVESGSDGRQDDDQTIAPG